MSRRRGCLALAVPALALGACGGSADGGGTSESGATREVPSRPTESAAQTRFIARADLTCQKLDVVLNLEKPRSTSPREVARLVPGRVQQEERSVAELRRLNAPPALSATWREMLRLRAQLAHELSRYAHAVAVGDTGAVVALTRSKAGVHRQLGSLGRAAGFDECSAVR